MSGPLIWLYWVINEYIQHKGPCTHPSWPTKNECPIISKEKALATPKVYVVAACLCTTPLHNKKCSKRPFLCVQSKKVTSTTPLNIGFYIHIIEFLFKNRTFLLNKLKNRAFSTLISIYGYYINFGRVPRLFFTNNGSLIFGGSNQGGTRYFVSNAKIDTSKKSKMWTSLI